MDFSSNHNTSARQVEGQMDTAATATAAIATVTSTSDESVLSSKYLTLVEGVDKELTCAICLSRYMNPKVLPCLHSYCRSCLEGLLTSSLQETKPQVRRVLTCPQCKEEHVVPPEGIDSFKSYFTINNLLELLHIHEVSNVSGDAMIQCESGLDDNPAHARCLTCAEYICEKCYVIHQRLKATKDHNVITLEKIRQSDKRLGVKSVQQRQFCDEHEDEVLKLFCKTCERVICRDCALVKHREHNFVFIREVCPETVKQLKGLQKEVEEKEKEFQLHKKYIGDLQKESEAVLGTCLKEVNGVCDKLIEAVESRRAVLIAELHSVHEEEEVKRKLQLAAVDLSLVRLSDSIHFTHNLLEGSDEVEMMSVGLQAMATLKLLKVMTWYKEKVKPTLLRLKFPPLETKIGCYGEVVNTVQPSETMIKNNQEVHVDVQTKFTAKRSDEICERKYNTSPLPLDYDDIPVAVRRSDNEWTVSSTPAIVSQHFVEEVRQKSSQSPYPCTSVTTVYSEADHNFEIGPNRDNYPKVEGSVEPAKTTQTVVYMYSKSPAPTTKSAGDYRSSLSPDYIPCDSCKALY